MEDMEELSQLSESIRQAASLLADDDPSDDSAPRRPSTFLNAVVLGNVVSTAPPSPGNPPYHPLVPRSDRSVPIRLCRAPASRPC
jgi:dynamin GTPase